MLPDSSNIPSFATVIPLHGLHAVLGDLAQPISQSFKVSCTNLTIASSFKPLRLLIICISIYV